jgi:hypothetical protein
MALSYPFVVAGRAGLPTPMSSRRLQPDEASMFSELNRLGSYTPGMRLSNNVEDRRPTSIWSWPR